MKKLLLIILAFSIVDISILLGKNSQLKFNYTNYHPNDSTKGQDGQNKPHIPKPPKASFLYNITYDT